MSEDVAFSFGGWIALLIGIWFLFEKCEAVATTQTKRVISGWLTQLETMQQVVTWPRTFARVFDHVFGEQHLSWRCFARSSVASVAAVVILFLVSAAAHPRQFVRGLGALQAGDVVFDAILLTIALNVIPDYLSLLKTRGVIRWMNVTATWRRTLIGLGLDLVATAVIAAVAAIVCFNVMASIFLPSWSLSLRDQVRVAALWMRQAAQLSSQMSVGVPGAGIVSVEAPIGIWFYAAFFPSAWVWLYVASGAAVKLVHSLGSGWVYLGRILDVEGKPLTSLGWVAMLLVTVVYWAVAVTSVVAH